MGATIFTILYIISVIVYYILLRRCTIEDNGWGLNKEVAAFGLFFGLVPVVSIAMSIMMYTELRGFKGKWWEVVLFIKRKE